ATTAATSRRVASRYLASSIPVIAIVIFPDSKDPNIITSSHALTLVGYTQDPSGSSLDLAALTDSSHVISGTDYVSRFIVQDDSGGPMRFAELLDWSAATTELKELKPDRREEFREQFGCLVRLDSGTKTQEIAYLNNLIIPLPLRVT